MIRSRALRVAALAFAFVPAALVATATRAGGRAKRIVAVSVP